MGHRAQLERYFISDSITSDRVPCTYVPAVARTYGKSFGTNEKIKKIKRVGRKPQNSPIWHNHYLRQLASPRGIRSFWEEQGEEEVLCTFPLQHVGLLSSDEVVCPLPAPELGCSFALFFQLQHPKKGPLLVISISKWRFSRLRNNEHKSSKEWL